MEQKVSCLGKQPDKAETNLASNHLPSSLPTKCLLQHLPPRECKLQTFLQSFRQQFHIQLMSSYISTCVCITLCEQRKFCCLLKLKKIMHTFLRCALCYSGSQWLPSSSLGTYYSQHTHASAKNIAAIIISTCYIPFEECLCQLLQRKGI